MASIIQPWLHGWDVTSVTIRYQVAAATGLLGNGSSAVRTLTGVIDAIEYTGEDTEEEIAPLTSRYENTVSIGVNDSVRLVEIAANNLANGNFLGEAHRNGAAGGHYAIFTFTRDVNSVTYTGTMGELGYSIRQGKSVLTLDLAFLDIYTDEADPTPDTVATNPVYGT